MGTPVSIVAGAFDIPVGVVAGVFLLVVICTGTAMLGLYIVWRRGYVRGWRASRGAGPRCPRCGYNMTGLTRCRCPECGGEFGLDEMMAYVPDGFAELRSKS